jgi:hypothetical protein
MEAYQLALNDGKFDKEKLRFLRKPGGSIQESILIKGIVIKKRKRTQTCQTIWKSCALQSPAKNQT